VVYRFMLKHLSRNNPRTWLSSCRILFTLNVFVEPFVAVLFFFFDFLSTQFGLFSFRDICKRFFFRPMAKKRNPNCQFDLLVLSQSFFLFA
jgi:hypothetical protein